MEEINLKDLFSFFVKKIPIIMIVSVIVMLLGMLYNILFKKPLYYGNTTLILVQENTSYGQTSGITQNDVVLNQKLVATYTEIVQSRSVIDRVIRELDLEESYQSLKSSITVSIVNDTEIIKIAVSNRDSKEAVRIANKIADVFQEEVMEIYKLKNVSVIDRAIEQEQPYNIHSLRDAILYFAIGMILSVGVFFVIYYFDTSVKSSEEVEKRLGIPVIGTIPLSRKGK